VHARCHAFFHVPLTEHLLSSQVHTHSFEVLRTNPEWVVAHLTESKGTPLSAQVKQALVDNGVGSATAELL
jgi:hypothetical protein